MKRRTFLKASAMAPAALWAASAMPGASAATEKKQGPWVCVFTKHLQFLDYPSLAKTCRALELDGADLTVRPGGHVLPENVKRDLPKAAEVLRGEGLEVPMITTNYSSAQEDGVREVLETASALGIKYVRVGPQKYSNTGPILPQLDRFTEDLRGLAALAAQYGMTAGYHNHSGFNQVGGSLWDLHRMIQAVQSPNLGSNFDIAHAKAEGAYGGWQVAARLMAPYVKMMAVKDFVFPEKSTEPRWVPLGEGVVPIAECLKIMREAGFQGPISMHFEYRTESNERMIEEIGRAAKKLRAYLKEAGY